MNKILNRRNYVNEKKGVARILVVVACYYKLYMCIILLKREIHSWLHATASCMCSKVIIPKSKVGSLTM